MSSKNKREEQDNTQPTSDLLEDIKELVTQGFPAMGEVPVRCLSIAGGKILFGIFLSEFSDSIILGLTSTLVSNGPEVTGKLISTNPVMRMFKYNAGFMVKPEKDHLYYYYRHLLAHQDKMPEFFTPSRLQTITDFLKSHTPEPFKQKNDVANESKSQSSNREYETEDDFLKDMMYSSMNQTKVTKH